MNGSAKSSNRPGVEDVSLISEIGAGSQRMNQVRCGWFRAALFGLVLAASLGAQSPQQMLEQAVALQEQGRAAEALELYRRLLDLGYDHPDLLTNVGAAYAAVGDFRQAIATYERARSRGGDSLTLHFNLGLAYYKSDQAEAAQVELDRVLQLDPGQERARLLLADLLFQQGETATVVELLRPLAGAASRDPAVAYLLGTALILEGRVAEGQSYIDVVMRQPDSAPARVMLATAYLRANRLDQAAAEIEQAIALAPEQPGNHAILGQILLREKQLDRAQSAFRRELELNPRNFDANFHLGSLLKDQGRYDEALPLLARAVTLRPQAAEALFQLGELHVFAGDAAGAKSLLEELVDREPRFVRGHALLAAVYHRLGMSEEAARQRELVVQLNEEEEAAKPKERRNPFKPSADGRPEPPDGR